MATTIDVSDLVGVPYPGTKKAVPGRPAMHCWALARAALGRVGVSLPTDPGDALAAESLLGNVIDATVPRRAGDVVMMTNPDEGAFGLGLHIGVVVDGDGSVLHATPSGSRIDRLGMLEKTGAVLRVVRPRFVARMRGVAPEMNE